MHLESKPQVVLFIKLTVYFIYFIFKDFIYFIFRKLEGREEEWEKHQCVVACGMLFTGDLARNPDVCPDEEWNWQPFGLQSGAQSTKPHHPGLTTYFKICVEM